jgi:hypothetical protein
LAQMLLHHSVLEWFVWCLLLLVATEASTRLDWARLALLQCWFCHHKTLLGLKK